MKRLLPVLAFCLLQACGPHSTTKVIVFGVDGMDPAFVVRHWADLPALNQLRQEGTFSRLATTDPPQSPVAWSSFITGLDPAEHGIFDFVHRDAATHEPYLSISHTTPSRLVFPFGPWELPLRPGGVELMRKGQPFWEQLAERDIPVSILHMPANFPPSKFGEQLAGMGTPDLLGTQGTYTLIDHAGEVNLQGPANTLRRDHAPTTAKLRIDIDADHPVARFQLGNQTILLNEGEWSAWLPVEFPLVPYLATTRGMVRIFARQLHPAVAIYVTPINIDPLDPALPIAHPASLAPDYSKAIGRYPTVGIPQDTTALRNGAFTLPEFLAHTADILNTERRLLTAALDRYKGGLLFFYFSSVDQNSHILWGKNEAKLLEYYQGVDSAIADARSREPAARIIVMSDHGFTSFDRAVNLNAWLRQEGLLTTRREGTREGQIDWQRTRAWALGLNGLYLTDPKEAPELRRRLMELKDPETGKPAITAVGLQHPSAANRATAPTLTVGYAEGYRASWSTGLGEVPDHVFDTNTDAWLGDHCVDPTAVPGVLFVSKGPPITATGIKDLGAAIVRLFGQ